MSGTAFVFMLIGVATVSYKFVAFVARLDKGEMMKDGNGFDNGRSVRTNPCKGTVR